MVIKVDESVIAEGDLKTISQAAIEEARRWMAKVGPERVGALSIYAKVFEQAIKDMIRMRIAEIERQKHLDQIKRWESEALSRALNPMASGWREAPQKPKAVVVVAATLEELL